MLWGVSIVSFGDLRPKLAAWNLVQAAAVLSLWVRHG